MKIDLRLLGGLAMMFGLFGGFIAFTFSYGILTAIEIWSCILFFIGFIAISIENAKEEMKDIKE